MVEQVRQAIGLALQHQDKVEPLLKEAPGHAARLAEELPKVGTDLARILRDTQKLKEVASSLRQAQKGIETAVVRWPELRRTLTRLAVVLNGTRDQLDKAVSHRDEYENALEQTVQVASAFAGMLPLITDQLDNRLDEEEITLSELGQSLDEVQSVLPAYAETAARLLHTGKLLAWLAAAIVGLHGLYLTVSAGFEKRFSI